MATGNGSDKAEAEPVAGGVATPFQPVKALEYVLKFIDRDSRPVIAIEVVRCSVRNCSGDTPTIWRVRRQSIWDRRRRSDQPDVFMNRDPRFALSQEVEAKQTLLDQLRALAADDPDFFTDLTEQKPAA
jgi:hypothetical protein